MAENVIENWVKLTPGILKRLHFVDHRFTTRTIHDSLFDREKRVSGLVFLVDEEDGKPVDKTLSVLSEKLSNDLSGYIEERRYRNFTFVLSKEAPGSVPPRVVEIVPR